MVAVYVPDQAWALPTLAAISIFYASLFYWLCFGLLAGLKASSINHEIEVADAWSRRMIQTLATIVLIASGDMVFIVMGVFTLPWIITNTVTDMFATLVKWNILEVTDKE